MKRLVLILFVAACGCASTGGVLHPQNRGNFHLTVSNQSFAVSPVDITIHIDGKRAVSRKFHVGNQHNFTSYVFQLVPGKHNLVAVSRKGSARFEKKFEVTNKVYVVVSYIDKQFSVTISDKPMGIAGVFNYRDSYLPM